MMWDPYICFVVGNEYENDGFIVNDEDEEEEEEEDEERKDSDEERQKKKKKRKKKDEGLDEDDYLLLQDNNVKFKKRQYKRLKKAQREQGNGQGESSDDEFDSRGGTRRSAEDKIKDRLFDDVDVDDPPDDVGDEEDLVVEEDVVGSEDEMADFIVDEDDEHGPPKRGNSKKKKYRQGSDITAMRDANEIFGDVDELLTIRKKGLASNQRMERRLEDEFEPTVLSEKYMTGNDDEIRQLDIPERMQISEESTGSPPVDEISIEEESNWIYAQLASQLRESDGTFDGRGFSVNKDDIAKFLELHHVQKLEVLDSFSRWIFFDSLISLLMFSVSSRYRL
jgi:transcription elongation factor SPT6